MSAGAARNGAAGHLDAILGIDIRELSADEAVASFEVGDEHRQRFGLVHGGIYAAVAEFLASEGTVHSVAERGSSAVGSSNQTSFLRPIVDGTVRVIGRPRYRGGRSWLWDVDFVDPNGRLCATSRVTLAIVKPPAGPPEPIAAPYSMRENGDGRRRRP